MVVKYWWFCQRHYRRAWLSASAGRPFRKQLAGSPVGRQYPVATIVQYAFAVETARFAVLFADYGVLVGRWRSTSDAAA